MYALEEMKEFLVLNGLYVRHLENAHILEYPNTCNMRAANSNTGVAKLAYRQQTTLKALI